MSEYNIHRLKESVRQQFRWAPHTIGLSMVRPRDYELAGRVDALSPYAAWMDLKDTAEALQPGDILESAEGDLRIYKYVGFEQAQWQLPETKAGAPDAEPASGTPVASQGVAQ